MIHESITSTENGMKSYFTANLRYDLFENSSKVVNTDPCYVQGKASKTKEEAIYSLDAEIFEKKQK